LELILGEVELPAAADLSILFDVYILFEVSD
jgi:hypothetical protein